MTETFHIDLSPLKDLIDYPAAHSMDTEWFGVDREGRVAIFDSMEDGAVPVSCANIYGLPIPIERFISPCELIYDLSGYAFNTGSAGSHVQPPDQDNGWTMLLFLDDISEVQIEIHAGRATEVPCAEGRAITWSPINPQIWQLIHDMRLCGTYSEQPSHWGFYTFDHPPWNGWASPYGRRSLPESPIHVDQLPPSLRSAMNLAVFENLSFAETTRIQPVEHVLCAAWSPACIDVTGQRLMPIPGMDGYDALISQLSDDILSRFQVEQPLDSEED